MQTLQPSNRLLEALPRICAERMLAASTHVDLPVGTTLFLRDQRPRYLYFLTSGMASVIFTSKSGTSIELATQSSEGLIGWASLLGPAQNATDCNMQVAGTGYRISLARLQREFDGDAEIRRRVLEYAQHQNTGSVQLAACNRLHRAEARFARWLLMVSDRLGKDDLPMTQEFMATMLGTRRTTLAEVCASLSRAGALESRRGGVRLTDRNALKRHACECYSILRERFESLYSPSPRPGDTPA